MRFKLNCLFLCIFFTLLAVGLACAQTDTPSAPASPWYAPMIQTLLLTFLPMLITGAGVFITKEITSHKKTMVIAQMFSTVMEKVKPFEPIAKEALSTLEKTNPKIAKDVSMIEKAAQTPLAQAAINAAKTVATNVVSPPA